MSQEHASWDDRTCSLLLDLINKQKHLCHWNATSPTSLGWTNVIRGFNKITRLEYNKKKCTNKYNELKRLYFNWRDGQTHTRLGHDPLTGELTAAPRVVRRQPLGTNYMHFLDYFLAIRFPLTQY